MKKYWMLIMSLILFQGSNSNSYGQCSPNCKSCKKKQHVSASNSERTGTPKALSCKLTGSELRDRKQQIISVLTKRVLEEKDLPNGYSFKFNESDGMLDSIVSFVKSERLCCDFLNFRITMSNDSSIWFDIYGSKGVKEFIKTELGM